MSSVEERVVGLKFDNVQFHNALKATIAGLEELKKSLKLDGATKGLSDLDAAGKSVKLDHIANSVDNIAGKFKAMSVVAITALAAITTKALQSGLALAESLTVRPITSGLKEYETNLNSIQTILSNTQWQNTGLNDVTKALQTLNEYSDQTIYNFSEMARNIGTFTAAGVKLEVAVGAIKGIANLAAISGSNAEQASSAMYQLSQALAAGKLSLMDWNSVVNAGLGGKVFQDALIETARVHHVAIDSIIKDAGSFRNSLEQGWITSDILTETLAKFTGDLTAAQLKTMGYNEQQIAGILKMGKTAQDAATKVKTVSQLMGTLQEAAGSGWAQTWALIFGDFDEAKTLFTSVNEVLGGFIKTSSDTRNHVIKDWKELGGRTALIQTIANVFNAVMAVVKPVKDAFREIFPPASAQRLYEITVAIRDFTERLKIGGETAGKLQRVFAGIFAVFGIGLDVIKQVVRVFFELLGMAGKSSGGILDFAANVGDFVVRIRQAIHDGTALVKFFDGLKNVIAAPIKLLVMLGEVFRGVFGSFDGNKAADEILSLGQHLTPLGKLAEFVAFAWGKVVSAFDDVAKFFAPLATKFVTWFHEISEAVGGLNFATLLAAINTGLFAALVLSLRKKLGAGGGLTDALEQLTNTLGAMQTTLRAATLLQIAAAVGILVVSVVALSKIDSEGLARALGGLGVMFAQLIAALYVLQLFPGNNVIKLYAMAASLIVLAVAVDVLAIAVKSLSELSWSELIKGLVGVSVLIAAIVAAANFLPSGAKLVSVGLGLLVLSTAIKVLASAVKDLSGLNWDELARGLAGVGALLASLALFSKFAAVNASSIIGAAGIVLLAAGIKILASALLDISKLSWEDIGKGMTTLAGGLTLMAAALVVIPPTAPLQAAGIAIVAASILILADALEKISGISWENVGKGMVVIAGSLTLITAALVILSDAAPTALLSAGAILIVALAMQVLVKALDSMGQMSWEEIAKSMVVLAGALTIITVALTFMTTALPGAAALLVVSGALLVLSSVLVILGNMSWGEIGKGLFTLAAAFAVLGIAALLLTPVIPALLGLGAAITLLGLGLALAGAGVFLFAAGLTALSIAGAAGAAAIVAIVSAVITLIPTMVQQIGVALLLLIKIVAEAAPEISALILSIIINVLEGIDKLAPILVVVLKKLMNLMLNVLIEFIPKMTDAGLKILIGVLEGIRDNIFRIVQVAAQVIERFLAGIGHALPGIIQSGVNLIISFIRGVRQAIDNNSTQLGDEAAKLGLAIIKGMIRGLASGGGQVASEARNVARNALNAAKDALGISSPSKEFMSIGRFATEGFAVGLENYSGMVEESAANLGTDALKSLKDSLTNLTDLVHSEIELTPTVTPVLDLSKVKSDADRLSAMFASKPIEVGTTFTSAQQVSNDRQKTQDDFDTDDPKGDTTNFTYNQYNNSPKALSTAEIYRNTKNQLSTVKEVLPK